MKRVYEESKDLNVGFKLCFLETKYYEYWMLPSGSESGDRRTTESGGTSILFQAFDSLKMD